MFRKIIQLLLYLLAINTVLPEGFIAGTLIKTKNGYDLIEKLNENDYVISYSFKNKELYECKILKVKKQYYSKAIKIKANGNEIIAAPDHKFYLPLHPQKKWVIASELKPKDSILRNIKDLIQVDEVTEVNGADFYSLSIDQHHNFFVTNQDILVHNFAIMLGTLFGMKVTLNIIGFGAALTSIIAYKVFGLKMDNRKFKFTNPNDNKWNHFLQPKHNFNNEDPKKVYDHVKSFISGLLLNEDLRNGVHKYATVFNEKAVEFTFFLKDKLVDISNIWFKR